MLSHDELLSSVRLSLVVIKGSFEVHIVFKKDSAVEFISFPSVFAPRLLGIFE